MDGTLTPPRKKMNHCVADALTDLQREGIEIGILTGSDMDYIEQQCDKIFDISPVDPFKMHFLPCNGTKYYKLTSSGFKAKYSMDMQDELSSFEWHRLISLITNLQSTLTQVYKKLPLTGNFINFRGSTINWAPIGRKAKDKQREDWIAMDEEYNIRKTWLKIARHGLDNSGLENVIIKLGGDTSFDIYPKGWDKTFGFKLFKNYQKIYFVGDRCDVNGNDREAYLAAGDLGYSVTGPEDTIKIINEIIKKEKSEKN